MVSIPGIFLHDALVGFDIDEVGTLTFSKARSMITWKHFSIGDAKQPLDHRGVPVGWKLIWSRSRVHFRISSALIQNRAPQRHRLIVTVIMTCWGTDCSIAEVTVVRSLTVT